MERLKKLRCIDSFTLKLLAMALMLCDHMWATIVPGNLWLTCLGRLAFPIFAYQIVEGFFCTRNFRRYWGRLFLFALLSEVPFNLMYGGSPVYPFHQNVLFTFCLALLLVRLLEKVRERSFPLFLAATPLAAGAGYLLGMVLMVDYYGYGVLTVLVFYFARRSPWPWLLQLAGLGVINLGMMGGMQFSLSLFGRVWELPQQGLALLALLPIWLYNGRPGRASRPLRLACYAFYPVHMAVLVFLWRMGSGV